MQLSLVKKDLVTSQKINFLLFFHGKKMGYGRDILNDDD